MLRDIGGDGVVVAGQLGTGLVALEQIADSRGQLRAQAGGALDRVGELGRVRGGQRDDRDVPAAGPRRARRAGRWRCAGR